MPKSIRTTIMGQSEAARQNTARLPWLTDLPQPRTPAGRATNDWSAFTETVQQRQHELEKTLSTGEIEPGVYLSTFVPPAEWGTILSVSPRVDLTTRGALTCREVTFQAATVRFLINKLHNVDPDNRPTIWQRHEAARNQSKGITTS